MPLIYLPPKVVSSNKKNPTQKSTPQGESQAIPPDSLPDLNIPKPFIDKLTVNLTFKSEQAYETHGAIYQALTNSDYFASVGKPAKGFQLAKQIAIIAIPDCESYPRIDYRFHADPATGGKLADRIRLEFNPSKLGYWGLKNLHATLSSVIDGGWAVFVKHGRISRLDVAVDLVGVRITKLKIVPPIAVQLEGQAPDLPVGQAERVAYPDLQQDR